MVGLEELEVWMQKLSFPSSNVCYLVRVMVVLTSALSLTLKQLVLTFVISCV